MTLIMIGLFPIKSNAENSTRLRSTWLNKFINGQTFDLWYGPDYTDDGPERKMPAEQTKEVDFFTGGDSIMYIHQHMNIKYSFVDNFPDGGTITLIKWDDHGPNEILSCYKVSKNWSGDFGFAIDYSASEPKLAEFDPQQPENPVSSNDVECKKNFNHSIEMNPYNKK